MTILELSQKLNVSKTAVRKYMTEEFRELYCSSRPNGAINISAEGITIITEKIGANSDHKPTENDRPKTTESQVSTQLLEFMQKQLSEKDKQIGELMKKLSSADAKERELTSAVQRLTEALQGEQALHAGTMQQQLLPQEINDEPEHPKKHWWQRKK